MAGNTEGSVGAACAEKGTEGGYRSHVPSSSSLASRVSGKTSRRPMCFTSNFLVQGGEVAQPVGDAVQVGIYPDGPGGEPVRRAAVEPPQLGKIAEQLFLRRAETGEFRGDFARLNEIPDLFGAQAAARLDRAQAHGGDVGRAAGPAPCTPDPRSQSPP